MPRKKTIEDYIIDPIITISLEYIHPDEHNVREHFTLKEMRSLARSIAREGQIQPSLVERRGRKPYHYHIVSGNRRYFAVGLAYDEGWIDQAELQCTVTRRLPSNLRLKVQLDENTEKERVPSHLLAESLWGKYLIMLADRIEGRELRRRVREAETFDELKELGISQLLPIRQYARMVGRDPKTISRAFSYQKLNAEIKKRVEQGKVSYSAAVPLATIRDRHDQRSVLASVTRTGQATLRRVKEAVQRYEATWEEGFFLGPRKLTKARTQRLKELSVNLGTARSLVEVLETVSAFDSSILDLEVDFDSRVTPRDVLEQAYKSVRQTHQQFLDDSTYTRRWEYEPKRTALADLVNKKKRKKRKERERTMDAAHFQIMSLKKATIRPNPLNPRGKASSFNQENIEELARSIQEVGLIQPLVLMKTGKDKYVILEGHRRFAALGMTNVQRFRALILPKLSEEEQQMFMFDADIFEEVNIHDMLTGIARQYEIESKHNPELTVSEFCRQKARWSPRVVKNAISYYQTTPEVKELCRRGLISYQAAVILSEIEDIESQKEIAQAAAIMGQSVHEVRNLLRQNKNQATLWPKEEINKMRREGQKKDLIMRLQQVLLGITEQLRRLTPRDKKRFFQDYYLTHRFQTFFKTLEETIESLRAA